jgi:UDP-glucose 4-epimerase
MRVLITGGLGYLGGRLALYFLHQGYNVFVGTRKDLKNIKEPLSNAIPMQIDWANCISLESTTKGMDVVVHAAGLNAKVCSANPVKALEVNGLNTAKIVAAAIESDVRRFIYISTVHVYRNPMIGNINESTSTANLNPYATSKLAGEKVVLNASQMGKMLGIVLRLSNGSGHPVFRDTKCWHLIFNDLCRQAVQERKLTLYSESTIERNFISMSNICLGIEYFLRLPEKDIGYTPVNLCSEMSYSLHDLAHLISNRCKAVFGYELEIVSDSREKKSRNNKGLHFSTKKLEKMGLILENNLEQEIDKTLLFCKRNDFAN